MLWVHQSLKNKYLPCVFKTLFLTLHVIPYRTVFWESVNYLKIVGKWNFCSCCELSWVKWDCIHALLYTQTLKVEEGWTVSSVTESRPWWWFKDSCLFCLSQSVFHFFLSTSLFVNPVSLYISHSPCLSLSPPLDLSRFVFLSVSLLVCLSALLVIFGV